VVAPMVEGAHAINRAWPPPPARDLATGMSSA
jgi:hypothetical protein